MTIRMLQQQVHEHGVHATQTILCTVCVYNILQVIVHSTQWPRVQTRLYAFVVEQCGTMEARAVSPGRRSPECR